MATVLVVDDIPNNRYFLRQLLKSQGHETIEAENGEDALLKVTDTTKDTTAQTPDLVISDILMPQMDGFALCRQWKADKQLSRIPFIFYTAAYGRAEDETFARSLGADAFLLKPQSNETLLSEISVFLNSNIPSLNSTTEALSQTQYLENYSERLASKLQEQVEELAKKNQVLMEREQQLKQAQSQLENKVQLRTRELQQANRELVSFCHSLTHDLKAPTRSIHGFATVLMEDALDRLDKEDKSHLKRILVSSERIEKLIQAMMRLYQISHEKMHCQHVNLSKLAHQICDDLQKINRDRHVHINIQDNIHVEGDPQMLRLALENLIGNAWKYTRNTDNAEIEFCTAQIEGRTACFVRDNGAGFNMQNIDKLFVAFERLHHPDDFEGNGIGLTTVERIIKRHHGSIWAESTPNVSTTFYFYIAMS